ncbi:MAG: SagB/ThcOx family dehydrogenase [Nitrososphaerota archaeon]|nr:SagB/ThcOx family dehydrogenase [Candidatus Calditenuaceae archaeon]MDW8073254.1 SagB/ThcOx family dehydrogenase [Nitrososphaerota archaeon]
MRQGFFEGRWGSDAARKYHEETKHSYASVRSSLGFLDFRNKPYPFKYYVSGSKIQLPENFERPEKYALEALSCRKRMEPGTKISISTLASILYFSAGVSRVSKVGDSLICFRVAPATGALYSTELYPVVGRVEGLNAGVYHFDPAEFVLTKLRSRDYRGRLAAAIQEDAVAGSPLSVIFTAVGWRNAWKYRERSYRHWFWDGGAVIANFLATSCSFGLDATLYVGFEDGVVNELVGVDGDEEAAFAVVSVEDVGARGEAANLEEALMHIEAAPAHDRSKPVKYPIILRTHASTSLSTREDVAAYRDTVAHLVSLRTPADLGLTVQVPPPLASTKKLWEVILERGSTRRFARNDIGAAQLSSILTFSFGPLKADFLPQGLRTLIHPHLIINAVEGVPSGAYRYIPNSGELRLLKRGQFREAAGYLCLEQSLGRDAAVVVFNLADLDAVLDVLGGRGYRAVQLEGGVRLGNLYLAAYSLGLGATGLTFYDDDVVEFFSPSSEGLEVLTVVAIGRPAYSSRPGSIRTKTLKHPAKLL